MGDFQEEIFSYRRRYGFSLLVVCLEVANVAREKIQRSKFYPSWKSRAPKPLVYDAESAEKASSTSMEIMTFTSH